MSKLDCLTTIADIPGLMCKNISLPQLFVYLIARMVVHVLLQIDAVVLLDGQGIVVNKVMQYSNL